jgi:hypothetical protein
LIDLRRLPGWRLCMLELGVTAFGGHGDRDIRSKEPVMERNRVHGLLVACGLVVLGCSAMAFSDIQIKGTDGDIQAGNQPGTRKSQGQAPTDRSSRSAQLKAKKSQLPPGSVPDRTKKENAPKLDCGLKIC